MKTREKDLDGQKKGREDENEREGLRRAWRKLME